MGDFSADSKDDILAENFNGTNGVMGDLWAYHMDGTTILGTSGSPTEVPSGWAVSAVGRLNNDASYDIVISQAGEEIAATILHVKAQPFSEVSGDEMKLDELGSYVRWHIKRHHKHNKDHDQEQRDRNGIETYIVGTEYKVQDCRHCRRVTSDWTASIDR